MKFDNSAIKVPGVLNSKGLERVQEGPGYGTDLPFLQLECFPLSYVSSLEEFECVSADNSCGLYFSSSSQGECWSLRHGS